MAISEGGVFGQYRGKLGKLVYYQLNGKTITRTIGVNLAAPSKSQLACRQEMRVVNQLLKPALAFINVGFSEMAFGTDKSPYNYAVKYNKSNALQGSYPSIAVDYSKAIMAQGTLLAAQNPVVDVVTEGLRFSWTTDPDMLWPAVTDQTLLLAYFPDTGEVIFKLYGTFRESEVDILTIPLPKQSAYMETYISFVSANRKQTANSIYTGSINL